MGLRLELENHEKANQEEQMTRCMLSSIVRKRIFFHCANSGEEDPLRKFLPAIQHHKQL